MNAVTRILALCAVLGPAAGLKADVTVTVNSSQTWLGYMNVFELPANGGAFLWGSGWGTVDLVATFSGSTLTLAPNTIGDAAEYWYIGGGAPGNPGNKIMEANMYVEPAAGSMSGQKVTFSGNVSANTLTGAHTAIAFIKDFAPDWSTYVQTTVVLTPGPFSISLDTINDPARHVQYGFQMVGPNVWITDVEPFGSVVIDADAAEPGDPNVTVDPGETWLGYVNLFNLPEPDDDGLQQFGVLDVLPPAALTAVFDGAELALTPFPFEPEDGLDDPFWYLFDAENEIYHSNKIVEANMYVEPLSGVLTGQTVVFSGVVLSNTLTAQHTCYAFIKDYAADYSSFVETRVALIPGPFSISLVTTNAPGRHVQYGFQTVGLNVWPADLASFGSVVVTAAAAGGFDEWIAGFDFSGFTDPDLSADGDPDGDGRSNLDEFGFDDDPTTGAASGKLRAGVESIGSGRALVLTLPVRGNPAFTAGAPAVSGPVDGIVYTIGGSNDLAAFDQAVSEVTPALDAGMLPLNPGWNYRSFRLDGEIGGATPRGPAGFLRAGVSPPP